MNHLSLDLNACPKELRQGLSAIKDLYPQRFSSAKDALNLKFIPDRQRVPGLQVIKQKDLITIRYGRKTDAFRALGRVMGELRAKPRVGEFAETPKLDMLGVMVDCSRNGVLRPEAARTLLCHMALMGYNCLMLYTEDTYEIPGEPFFGYLRGRYTKAELQALDKYADTLGIEMFPCIQTLAHLAQILQWPAYYDTHRDTDDILLAGDKKTLQLVEKMIKAVSAPFRSRRIHLGMDEAHGIGTGVYRKRFGERNRFEILNDHLAKVRAICRKQGLKPMIWSDMYFRLGSKTSNYYDRKAVIPPEAVAKIPKDVGLIYWDYYHHEQSFYEDMIKGHRTLGSDPIVAGGIWTWNHFWTALPFALAVSDSCMKACKKENIREVFMTLWGDDGMECDVFSSLPGLQFCAEHAYADAVDQALLEANFHGSCNATFQAWLEASGVDSIPGAVDPSKTTANISKWLLWQDPVLSHFDPQVGDEMPVLQQHYTQLAKKLARKVNPKNGDARLAFPLMLARALALKCGLRQKMADAYKANNRTQLRGILNRDLPAVRKAVDELWRCHRRVWLELYKPFGLEVLECRYGGVRTRLESFTERLRDYLNGKTEALPELEVEQLKLYPNPSDFRNFYASHAQAKTPSTIK